MSAHALSSPTFAASRRGIVVLLLLVLALDLTGVRWGLPHGVAPHVDDAAKPALDAMRHGFLGPTKYPKAHLMLLGAAYAPYLGWLYVTGGLHLSGASLGSADASVFRDPTEALTTLLLIARGVTIALHLGSVLLLWAVARRLVRHAGAALFAAALWGLAPVIALFARSSNVDVPMCFWLAATTLQFLRVREQPTRGRMLVLALVAVAGLGTKDQLVFAIAPFALAVPVLVWTRRAHERRAALRDLAVAAGVGLLAYALLSDLLLNPSQWAARQAAWRADLAHFTSVAAAHVGPADLARDTLRDLLWVGSPALALAVLAGLLSCAWQRTRAGLGWLGMAVCYLVLLESWLGFEQPRYVMPAAFFLCLFVACRADALLAATARRGASREAPLAGAPMAGAPIAGAPIPGAPILGAMVLLLASAHASQVAWALTDDSRRLAQQWIAAHIPAGTAVETYQDPNHLPGLNAVGLAPAQTDDMTLAGIARRAPAAIVISADEAWRWSAEQQRFVRALFDGPPGYAVARFGPSHGSRAPLGVDPTTPDRFWPDIAVLVRTP